MNSKNNINHKEVHDEFDMDAELMELPFLNEFSVDYPDEDAIEATVEFLEQYVSEKKKSLNCANYDNYANYIEKINYLLKRAAIDIGFISIYYWTSIFLIFVLGYISTLKNQGNPYATLLCLSPIPAIVGILEIFKGREEDVFEIEMACMISPNELIISRFILIIFYSIILNSVFTFLLIGSNFNISIWKIILLWLTPLIFMAGLALIISISIRSRYVPLILLSIWGSFGMALINLDWLINKIIYINAAIYIIILLLGVFMILYAFRKIMNIQNLNYKREIAYDIKNS